VTTDEHEVSYFAKDDPWLEEIRARGPRGACHETGLVTPGARRAETIDAR
jgi:hypothetical protein